MSGNNKYFRDEWYLMELASFLDGVSPSEWVSRYASAYREEWVVTDGHPTLAGVYRRARRE